MNSGNRLSLAIIIASAGRPRVLAQWRDRLRVQTQAPDATFFVVPSEEDLPAPESRPEHGIVIISPRGLCAQRNCGLERAIDAFDLIAFFDDDYIPSRHTVERIVDLFEGRPDLIAASGHLVLDGIGQADLDYDTALAAIDAYDAVDPPPVWVREHAGGLYGCNMVYRARAIGDLRFDERLPLYGWLEDLDFGAGLAGRGVVAYTNAFAGVHQGSKSGRGSGVRLGYSQVANPVYLWRKGTLSRGTALKSIARNLTMNVARAAFPEPWIDRAGRLKGNCTAIWQLLRGTLDPGNILQM